MPTLPDHPPPDAAESPWRRLHPPGAALVVGDNEELARQVFERDRAGYWLQVHPIQASGVKWCGARVRPLLSGGHLDWPCGTYSVIALGNGIELLEDSALIELAKRCVSSLDLHGEMELCLGPEIPTQRQELVRRLLSRAWPWFKIRRRLATGAECYAWRRTLGPLRAGCRNTP